MANAFTKEMWRTADGAIFNTQEEAVRHEIETQIHQLLSDRAAYGQIEVSEAVEIIMENWSALTKIMSQLV